VEFIMDGGILYCGMVPQDGEQHRCSQTCKQHSGTTQMAAFHNASVRHGPLNSDDLVLDV
jgi:hypothetical protein